MKVLTKYLTGAALDWAVAKAAGYTPRAYTEPDCGQSAIRSLTKWCGVNITPSGHTVFNPSADWAQGGPIIEREKIELHWDDGTWYAKHPAIRPRSKSWLAGPTALVAAMRVFVAYKVGSEVDIPEELIR